MNKISKEKRDRLLLVVVGTGVLLVALYFLLISPQSAALTEYRDKTDATREKLAKAERWLRMAPGIQAKLDTARKELELRQSDMAPLDKFKWFYATLEKFLAHHSIKLTDITREPEIGDVGVLPKFPYQTATFGVKINARYHDFGKFLADFENEFPYMRVKNLELMPETSARASGKETVAVDARMRTPENLAITMRVVTLIKPNAPL